MHFNLSYVPVLKVSVDNRMKQRMLKQCLEPYVGVSADHFKIHKWDSFHRDGEFYRPTANLTIYRDDDNLIVKLGRVLKKGEYLVKIFLLEPNNIIVSLHWA